jgi:hypothetical protein
MRISVLVEEINSCRFKRDPLSKPVQLMGDQYPLPKKAHIKGKGKGRGRGTKAVPRNIPPVIHHVHHITSHHAESADASSCSSGVIATDHVGNRMWRKSFMPNEMPWAMEDRGRDSNKCQVSSASASIPLPRCPVNRKEEDEFVPFRWICNGCTKRRLGLSNALNDIQK